METDFWFWILAGLATLFAGGSKGGLPLMASPATRMIAFSPQR